MAREPAPITAAAGSATNSAAAVNGGGGPPGQQKKRERKPQRPTNPDSKNQKKKARKKAKVSVMRPFVTFERMDGLADLARCAPTLLLQKIAQASWCWYCDREFEDDRILLSHQKAKHFRCPHCPRRLNTAGGLAVHIDQVHKLPVDRCVQCSCRVLMRGGAVHKLTCLYHPYASYPSQTREHTARTRLLRYRNLRYGGYPQERFRGMEAQA